MGGRDTPSNGLDVTAEFLKMNLQKWGFKPAGDNGTFFQKIALTRETLDADKTTLEIGGQAFKFADDFYRVSGNGSASGPIVFGKDGWLVKSKGIDAYAGVDVKGKIVVLYSKGFSQQTMIPRPEGVTDADLKGEVGVDWANPVAYAKAKGAAGVIVIAPPELQGCGLSSEACSARTHLVDKFQQRRTVRELILRRSSFQKKSAMPFSPVSPRTDLPPCI
jgi:hypothetical protein